MKIGLTVSDGEVDGVGASTLEDGSAGGDEGELDLVSEYVLLRIGRAVDSTEGVEADLASVLEVGTGAAAWIERLRAAALPEEVVVDVITRSTCEARLSDES